MNDSPVDLDVVLAGLKDFQRRTANYAYKRLFVDDDSSKRFLVADEVGLGKTLVAKGIIAHMVDALWKKGNKQIDIVYICCNRDLAAQNIERLKVAENVGFEPATRITLLARRNKGEGNRRNRLNFISLTPGTSFESRSNSLGEKSERVLLYHLVKRCRGLGDSARYRNMLAGQARTDYFQFEIDDFDRKYDIDESVVRQFKRLYTRELHSEFLAVSDLFPKAKDPQNVPDEHRIRRGRLIAQLRRILTESSISMLSPDIVILDEFQRFRDLLDENKPAGELAKNLFDWADDESQARVLLLSATPYKMYTMSSETAEEDHYKEFLNTVSFLFNNELNRKTQLTSDLKDFRNMLLRGNGGEISKLTELRSRIEANLRPIIARTERLALSLDRNGMLVEVATTPEMSGEEIQSFCQMQEIARHINIPDVLSYWKSSPYLLNFMDDYKLKKHFQKALDSAEQSTLRDILLRSPGLLLNKADIEKGMPVSPQNSQLRQLLNQMNESGAWKLLWMPPCFPYYPPAEPFDSVDSKSLTKRLIFSAWRVVPKVVSCLMSYDVYRRARRLGHQSDDSDFDDQTEAPLLRFSMDKSDKAGRMSNFAILYPSRFFATNCDPFTISAELQSNGIAPTLSEIKAAAAAKIREKLTPYFDKVTDTSTVSESWYWAAPLLLDLGDDEIVTKKWIQQDNLASFWHSQSEPGSKAEGSGPGAAQMLHIQRLINFAVSQEQIDERPPADLIEVLANIAIGSPANCAFRAFRRNLSAQTEEEEFHIRNCAASVARGFLGYFNRYPQIYIVRSLNQTQPYWKSVLQYSTNGCLQSVMDELCHVLKESLGLLSSTVTHAAVETAASICASLSLLPSSFKVDYYNVSQSGIQHDSKPKISARFALPLFEDNEDEEGDVSRAKKVQEAFNSPFWPFIVASTSIGQEGLDFHTYCHAVVHWNLPPNPVDMEQREGRVQRYKGHAIRKNIANKFSANCSPSAAEPWQHMFDLALTEQADGKGELTPYWIYQTPDGAHIERHIHVIPLSRESERLRAMRRTLAVYRLAFGQPRQEDLAQFLLEHNFLMTEEELSKFCRDLSIDLSPPDV